MQLLYIQVFKTTTHRENTHKPERKQFARLLTAFFKHLFNLAVS
jgi:hypothetical protein